MIKSNYPERTGKHFVCYCNQQIPGTSDYNIAQAALRSMDNVSYQIAGDEANAEKVNGVWEQRLRIHYNCVGTIEIPSALPLPTPDVSVNTRKGVVVNYAPCDVAI